MIKVGGKTEMDLIMERLESKGSDPCLYIYSVEATLYQEPIIQSEVSQKDKHQYSILTHIYGI